MIPSPWEGWNSTRIVPAPGVTVTFVGAVGGSPGAGGRDGGGVSGAFGEPGGSGASPSPGSGIGRRFGPPATLSLYLLTPLWTLPRSITTACGLSGSFAQSIPSLTKTSSRDPRFVTGIGLSKRLAAESYTI